MSDWSLRDKTCIAGVGTTEWGVFPETDCYEMGLRALQTAVSECGIKWSEIDGLIVNRIPSYERLAEMANLNLRYCITTPGEGRYAGISLMLACQAIAAGDAEVVALVYGNDGKSAGVKYGGATGPWGPWLPWGFTSPGAIHAMMFKRHMYEFGTSSEDLAPIAMTFRDHALRCPGAVMNKPITSEDYWNARFICEPLRLYDYCLINDGGVALIVTSAERARDLIKPPTYISGYARSDNFDGSAFPKTDYWYPILQEVAGKVYQRANIDQDAVSGLMIYDNFTPTVLFSLEGLGFCKQGEGGEFVREGNLALDGGRWPTNTTGGHLSESYMQGWGLLVEAVRQCRRECGDRQISDCEVVQYVCATNLSVSFLFRR